MIAYQLLRSFGYLSINHPAKKVVDWWLPILLSMATTLVLGFVGEKSSVWGSEGLIEKIQGLVQGLPGFYIAALAAVATFGRQTNLDSLIPEPTPTIDTWYGSGKVPMGLTRRRFLCLLFAHLTAVSIILSLGSALFLWAWKVIIPMSAICVVVGFYFSTFVYFLALSQLVLVTLWGLYYLSDKIHQPDAKPLIEDVENQE